MSLPYRLHKGKNMQVLVKEKEDFNTLKDIAIYSSERTGVMELDDSQITPFFAEILKKYKIKQQSTIVRDKPKIVGEALPNKVQLYIESDDKELSNFLNTDYKGTIPNSSFVDLFLLLQLGLVELDDNTKYLFSKDLNDDSEVSKLICSRFQTNFKKHRYSLIDNVEYIKDLNFNDCEKIEKEYYVYKDFKILDIVQDGNKSHYVCERDNKQHKIYVFGQLKYNIGDTINIMINDDKLNMYIFSAIFVPSCFPDKLTIKSIKTNKRTYPKKLLDMAYAEYNFRKND